MIFLHFRYCTIVDWRPFWILRITGRSNMINNYFKIFSLFAYIYLNIKIMTLWLLWKNLLPFGIIIIAIFEPRDLKLHEMLTNTKIENICKLIVLVSIRIFEWNCDMSVWIYSPRHSSQTVSGCALGEVWCLSVCCCPRRQAKLNWTMARQRVVERGNYSSGQRGYSGL